jgi:hypothetical protein
MVLPLVYTCSPTEHAGNSSQSGNAAVVGVLYNPGGTRAAGARVVFIPADNNPRAGLGKALVIDSAVTNDTGGYTIDSMPVDTYNVFGVGDSGLSYLDSVVVKPDSQAKPSDTLGAAGSVRGVIRLQPNHDSRTVFMLFMGTQTWVAPDDSVGNFRLANMAAGKYRVRILTVTPNYQVMDTSLSVTAGRDSVLPDTIRLRFTGIPVPTGVRLSYDTLRQIVTLTWSKADTNLVASYNVYRRNVGLNTVLARINASPVTDTVYRDSSGVQDSTYEYQVAAVDKNASEGSKGAGVSVVVTSAFAFIKNFGVAGTGSGQFSLPADIASDPAGNFWVVDQNRDKAMEFDSAGLFLREWGTPGSAQGQLSSPYGIDIDAQENIYISDWRGSRMQKFDSTGNLLMQIGHDGLQVGDVSVDENGNIYLLCSDSTASNVVAKYSADTTQHVTWPLSVGTIGDAILARGGKVYAVGSTDQAGRPYPDVIVAVFDTAGGPLGVVHVRQAGDTGAIAIRDLETDAQGNLYASDPENGIVRVFSSSLAYVTHFGRKGSGANDFSWIQGLAISRGRLLAVTDRSSVHLLALR